MTYQCPACKLLFEKMHVQCPQCRGPVVIDIEDAQHYLDRGYRRHGAAAAAAAVQQKTVKAEREKKAAQPSASAAAAASVPRIEDEELLESLRASYRRQHSAADERPVPPAPERPEPPAPEQPSPSAARQTRASDAVPVPPAAPVNPARAAASEDRERSDPFRIPDPPQFRERPHSHRRRSSGAGWFHFRNVMASIRWGTVFRVLLIGGVIALCITAWVQRQQILDAALDFIMSLVPGALIIGAIIWLLRKMIKG